MRKAQKSDCRHHIFAKVVEAFVFLLCHRDSEQAGWNKLQPTVVKKAPTFHFRKTLSTGATA